MFNHFGIEREIEKALQKISVAPEWRLFNCGANGDDDCN